MITRKIYPKAEPGRKNNYLTLIRREGVSGRIAKWRCRCDCGKEIVCGITDFNSGHTKSCGCYRRKILKTLRTTHGMSYSPEFKTWEHMLGRCYVSTNHKYPDYGARGIKVCDRWHDFANFYADVGSKPTPKHTIDRVDNEGSYEPNNCKWSSSLEQSHNKRNNVRLVVFGEPVVAAQGERMLGLCNGTFLGYSKRHGITHQAAVEAYEEKWLRSIGAVR